MLYFLRTPTRIALATLCIIVAGLVTGWLTYRMTSAERLNEMSRDARRCTLAFRMPQRAALTGSSADEDTAAYDVVKKRLMLLHDEYPGTRFIYLYRYQAQTKQLVCLADSEPPDSPYISHSGDLFSGQIKNADVLKTLSDGTVTHNESQSDMFGSWISLYARINDGDNTDILRVDIDSAKWRRGLLETAFLRACVVWFLLGAPFFGYLLFMRFSKQAFFIRKLIAAVEQCATPLLIMNKDGVTIDYVNNEFCALSEYGREQLIGKNSAFTSHNMPQEKLAHLYKLSMEGIAWSETFECVGKNERIFQAIINSTPIKEPNGNILGFLVIITDATALDEQAKQLRKAKEAAESAHQAKSTFLATMSHEVRTPLNGIVGFSGLLMDTPLNDEQREYVNAIQTGSHILTNLAENVLNYTRIEAGRLLIEPEPCDVRALIKETLAILRPAATGKNLQLLQTVEESVPQVALIDSTRVRQVLLNLACNAVKFTLAGTVAVHLCARSGSEQSNEVVLEFSVRDTGIGIAPEDQTRLFKPFVQLDSSNTRRYDGAGLGLVICYDLVRLMGGQIHIESELGKGSTFTFTVKCENVSAAELAA